MVKRHRSSGGSINDQLVRAQPGGERMADQTAVRMVQRVTSRPAHGPFPEVDRTTPALVMSPLFGAPVRKERTVGQSYPLDPTPAASLVGSLSVFTLSDVLTMLASTRQSGELQVVSENLDGRVWLDHGELSNAHVGTASTIGQAVFELACVSEGWFYFTAGLVSSSGHPPVSVAAVLSEVGPQVDEWREIRQVIPLGAVVTLAADPPGRDVQIRNDQWRVLTTIGSIGHSVRSLLEMIGGDQIVGLRTIRDLYTAGLIELGPTPSLDPVGPSSPLAFTSPAEVSSSMASHPSTLPASRGEGTSLAGLAAVPPVEADSGVGGAVVGFTRLAEVTILPPPNMGDPWSSSGEQDGTNDDGVA